MSNYLEVSFHNCEAPFTEEPLKSRTLDFLRLEAHSIVKFENNWIAPDGRILRGENIYTISRTYYDMCLEGLFLSVCLSLCVTSGIIFTPNPSSTPITCKLI